MNSATEFSIVMLSKDKTVKTVMFFCVKTRCLFVFNPLLNIQFHEIIDGDQLPVEPEMLSSPSPIAMRKSSLSLLYPP
jgi:hypothetical protein